MVARSLRKIVRLAAAVSLLLGGAVALAQDQPASPPAAPTPPASIPAAPAQNTASPPAQAVAPAPAKSAPTVTITANGGDIRALGALVSVTGTADSVSAAGANVSIAGTISGDVIAAGAQVLVDTTMKGHLRVAGASVQVKGQADRGIEAAGAVVLLEAKTVAGVRVAGASVTIGPNTDIQQLLEVAGASVDIAGHIGGAVDIVAANATFTGRTDASLTFWGGRLTIAPGARIAGDLVLIATEPVDVPNGAVMGTVRRVEPPVWWTALSPWAGAAVIAVAVALGTIVAGIVLALFGGRLFVTSVNQVRMRPGTSLLIGLITVILIPLIAAALMSTVIGFSAGLAVLFILPVLAIFGHAVAAAGIAGGIFVRATGRVGLASSLGLLILGSIIVALLALIPWVGPWLIAIVLLLGIGALASTVGGRMKRANAAVP